MGKILRKIQIGTYVEFLIKIITFGTGERISLEIAKLLGYDKCYCCERKQWLNRLTDKDYDGECNQIKL